MIGTNRNITGLLTSSPSYEDDMKPSYQTTIHLTPVLSPGSAVGNKNLLLYSQELTCLQGEARQDRKKACQQAQDSQRFPNPLISKTCFSPPFNIAGNVTL